VAAAGSDGHYAVSTLILERDRSGVTTPVGRLTRVTRLTAQVRDEAELFGQLERLRDLGAALVSVSIDP
jgi:hypothetical protein